MAIKLEQFDRHCQDGRFSGHVALTFLGQRVPGLDTTH
jgi:hypothetical protein